METKYTDLETVSSKYMGSTQHNTTVGSNEEIGSAEKDKELRFMLAQRDLKIIILLEEINRLNEK